MRRLPGQRSVFLGWYIALAGAVSNFFTIGVGVFALGVFITPMREELGWSVAAIAAASSLRTFEQGFLSPVSGFFVDWLGPRKMALGGLAFLIAGLVLLSQVHSLPMFYASSLIMALGGTFASMTPFSAVLMSWFVRKRGRAMGILNTGNGAGYLAAPILAFMVGAVGWRSTLLIATVAIAVVCLPLTLLLKEHPEDEGLHPDGAAAPPSGSGASWASSGLSVREALHTPAFYLLVLATAAGGWQVAWILLQIPHLENVGFSLEAAATLSGLYGAIQLGLRFSTGWLGDAFGRKRMYAFSFLLQGTGLLIFAALSSDRLWLLPFYFVTFSIGQAMMVVLGQTMIADYFGAARFASIRGLATTLNTPVGIITPLFAGYMFDRTGSYSVAWVACGVLAFSGAIWVTLIRRPLWAEVERERERAEEAAALAPRPAALGDALPGTAGGD
ncbi:MAG: MFS transporter [Dehalococcoidia bacterium]